MAGEKPKKKGVDKPKQTANSICKSKNQSKKQKDKTGKEKVSAAKTQNSKTIMSMINSMSKPQVNKENDQTKDVQIQQNELPTGTKGQEWIIDPSEKTKVEL